VSRRVAAWRAVCAAMLLLADPGRAAAPADEYQVKAVYLFNFGQFVEWPSRVFETSEAPFVICIFGTDPFGGSVDQVVRGEKLGSRPIVVERLQGTSDIGRCNILFIGRDEADRLEEALAAVRGLSVLTVTDVDGAEHRGAIIVLYNQNNRIRMRINLPRARASDLTISSKLLRPADVIGGENG
jgi:hypothetical protein